MYKHVSTVDLYHTYEYKHMNLHKAYVVLQRLTPRFWWHNPRHIGIFSDAQANDIDNAHIEATMGTGQAPSERGIGAGSWLHERSQELQRLASQARYMGATTDKGTQRRESTMEHSPEPQCEPSRKRHQAESATRGRPSRPRAAIRRLPDGLLGGLVDVAGWLSERHRVLVDTDEWTSSCLEQQIL